MMSRRSRSVTTGIERRRTRKDKHMRDDRDVCERAENYLRSAGFVPLSTMETNRIAMRRDSIFVSTVLQYEPAENAVRLAVTLLHDKPSGGLFRNGRVQLRIFLDATELFGLLCWISSSHDELLPLDVDTWLAQIANLCPQTFAVIATNHGTETLALLVSNDPHAALH